MASKTCKGKVRGDICIGFFITHGLNDWVNDGIIC